MEGLLFNIDSGYAEALVRGFRSGLISSSQYTNMTQCETLEDLKLQLSATEYGNFLGNVPSPLPTSAFQDKAAQRLVSQFRYIQTTAVEPLSTLLDYITYGYMIDNVVLLISGTVHSRDRGELLERCQPLGWFDTLPALSVATDVQGLYDTVLVDTPLAPYFKTCLSSANELTDMNVEIIRNRLCKAYLEDFAEFSKTLPSPSNEIMLRFLEFEADRRTINIAFNSIGTELSREERESLMPALGSLYPVATSHLVRTDEPEQVRNIIETFGPIELASLFDNSNQKSLEDHFYLREMELCRDAFTQQFTYATFYAWLRAAEQEVRNITWIAECIAQNQKTRINNYISVF
ncbi:V-type proton ATPase subunit d [Wickerhamiella sorbophila]|uniref:V-type proton ATPase subunit n=1 Tax=Wickerhamiella sorbophila TaxID=45607 RepID=A0A2T0FNX1_9ASCO|nr:V-type proton ATPase subunit d [Wickerhamiella sorbophila]PRT56678.1 V-type proton ATPase subunit d [Wickerhamiella sorbophila]